MHAVARVHVTVVVLALHQVLRDRRRCRAVAQRLRAHVLDDQLAVVVRTAARVLICPKKKNNQKRPIFYQDTDSKPLVVTKGFCASYMWCQNLYRD